MIQPGVPMVPLILLAWEEWENKKARKSTISGIMVLKVGGLGAVLSSFSVSRLQDILAQVDLFSPKWITCFSTLTKFWKHSWKWKSDISRSLQKPSEEQESRPCDENKDSNSSTAHFLPFLSLPPTFSQAHVNCLIHSEKRLEKSNFLTFLTKTSG